MGINDASLAFQGCSNDCTTCYSAAWLTLPLKDGVPELMSQFMDSKNSDLYAVDFQALMP